MPDGSQTTQQPEPQVDPAAVAAPTTSPAPATDAPAADPQEGQPPAAAPAEGKTDTEISYEFKVPEGVTLDAEVTGEFQALAKDAKLPAESAQKMVDLAIKLQEKQADAARAITESWAKATVADKEVGGDAHAANLATAKKAIEAFGSPELKQLLDTSGLGNHPEVVRFAYRVGKAISEDKVLTGGQPDAGTAPFYPNSQMNR